MLHKITLVKSVHEWQATDRHTQARIEPTKPSTHAYRGGQARQGKHESPANWQAGTHTESRPMLTENKRGSGTATRHTVTEGDEASVRS